MQVRQQLRRRWGLWRADAHYRRLFRQQRWQQRRARLRWELRRARAEQRGRWQRRSLLLSRQASNLRDLGSDVATSVRDRASAGSGRVAPKVAGARGRLSRAGHALASTAARLGRGLGSAAGRSARTLLTRTPHPPRRLVLTTALVLIGGVAGYAVISSVGDRGDGGPSADGTARPSAKHSNEGARVPGLTRPGIFLSVAVADVGALEVTEEARTGQPVTELSITPPPALEGSDRLPHLEDVQVTADGRSVTVPEIVEVTTVVVLDRPAKVIELHYRVVGASARSKPATPGRARLTLRPALATTLDDSRAVIEVHGTRVRALLCVELPAKQQLCGTARDGGWRTQRLDTASSAVVALVDLPTRTA
jgi:hypothetical protein